MQTTWSLHCNWMSSIKREKIRVITEVPNDDCHWLIVTVYCNICSVGHAWLPACLPALPSVMIITTPNHHFLLPSFIFLILLHFYITSTPFPACLSLSPPNLTIYISPLPSFPFFFHPISYTQVTFLISPSPPPPSSCRLSLFMCVCGVGANSVIALFSFHRIIAQISFFYHHQRSVAEFP